MNYIVNTELRNKGGKIYTFFADPAFDKVNRNQLGRVMERNGISQTLRTRMKEIYKETRNLIRVNGKTTDSFWATKGVRQGCPLKVLQKPQAGGIVIGKEKTWSLAYADDIALIAKTSEELKGMIGRMKRYLEKKGSDIKCGGFKRY